MRCVKQDGIERMTWIRTGTGVRVGSICALTVAMAFLLVVTLGGTALATTLTSPYVAVTVQAGQTVNFELSVSDTVIQRLDMSLTGVPEGWEANILGGGRPVSAIMTDPAEPSRLQLQVKVPADAEKGPATLTVVARADATSTTLPITLTVSDLEGGTTTMEADYTSLRGPATASYSFSLELKNSTLEARTYNLSVDGPANWALSLKPSGASQETPTVSVESQASQKLNLEVKPAPGVEIGTYDIVVSAVGGGETVQVPLQVEITGTYTLTITTPDGSLNADVKAGDTTKVPFVVTNSGTGPLQGVKLSATAPTNWEVEFEPAVIDVLNADEQVTVMAQFTPAENAIAGDYVVTLNASADQAAAQSDIRVTVKTSTLWGVIGVLVVVAVIAILAFVFRRYGHR